MANIYKDRSRPDYVLSEAGELFYSVNSCEQIALDTAEALAPGDVLRQIELIENFIGYIPWKACITPCRAAGHIYQTDSSAYSAAFDPEL